MKKKMIVSIFLIFILCNMCNVYSQKIDNKLIDNNLKDDVSYSEGTTKLEGHIYDIETGEPAKNIKIMTKDRDYNITKETKTDENGYYFIDYETDKQLNVLINIKGHYPHSDEIILEAGQLNNNDMHLTFFNTAPSINGEVYWTEVSTVLDVHFGLAYIDREQDYPLIKNVIIEGKEYEMDLLEVKPGGVHWYELDITIRIAGEYKSYFYFEDEYGGSVRYPHEGYQSFTVYNYPGTPINPNPINGATSVSRTITLNWDNAITEEKDYDVHHHKIYFGTDENPSYLEGCYEQEFKPSILLKPNTKYYWRVDTHITFDGGGATIRGPVWSFTTGTQLSRENRVKVRLFEIFPSVNYIYQFFIQNIL